ncbi:MAG TPA: manganese efflux pump MntP family protein [Kofleriaceae bacterium]
MDAMAVSAARAIAAHRAREAVILPLVFGGFQAAMSAAGWFAGARLGPYIAAWNRYVAFGLLLIIGGKMLVDALRGGAPTDEVAATAPPRVPVSLYLGLGIATSIDAAAAGITLPMVPVDPWISVALIGTITAACALLGFVAGRYLGDKLGTGLAAVGGLVLIGIGTKILITG